MNVIFEMDKDTLSLNRRTGYNIDRLNGET